MRAKDRDGLLQIQDGPLLVAAEDGVVRHEEPEVRHRRLDDITLTPTGTTGPKSSPRTAWREAPDYRPSDRVYIKTAPPDASVP